MSDDTPGVFIPIPLPEAHVFRYQAADDVLELLYRDPHEEFDVRQFRDVTRLDTHPSLLGRSLLLVPDLAVGDVEVPFEFREQLHRFVAK